MKIIEAVAGALLGLSVAAEPVNLTPELSGAKQPQIAAGAEGNVFICFGREDAVYFLKSGNGGDSFGAPKLLGEVKQLALGMRRGPRIAASGDFVTITAISHADGNLYAWRSEDAGEKWSGPVVVNTVPKSAREGMHDLAAHKNGIVYVAWLDLRNGKTELFGAKSLDGGRDWEENRLIYRSPDGTICECCHPTVRFTPGGEVVVMWRNWLDGSRDLYRAISSDGGETFGVAAKLGTGTWPLAACPMDGGNFDISPKGPVYAWRRERRLYLTTPGSAETPIAEGTHPIVVSAGEHLQIFWQEKGNLYWKIGIGGKPTLLAENAGFLSAVRLPGENKTLATWEQSRNGRSSVFLRALP